MTDNVIRPKFGEPPITHDREGDAPICQHQYVAIRDRSRTVVCRVCKQPVDPFEVLQRLAHVWQNATWLSADIEQKTRILDTLKGEISNAKATVRRAYHGAHSQKAELATAEMIRRLNNVTDQKELFEAEYWFRAFPWLLPEQTGQIKQALENATRRVRDAVKGRGRKRTMLKPIDGGGDAETN